MDAPIAAPTVLVTCDCNCTTATSTRCATASPALPGACMRTAVTTTALARAVMPWPWRLCANVLIWKPPEVQNQNWNPQYRKCGAPEDGRYSYVRRIRKAVALRAVGPDSHPIAPLGAKAARREQRLRSAGIPAKPPPSWGYAPSGLRETPPLTFSPTSKGVDRRCRNTTLSNL